MAVAVGATVGAAVAVGATVGAAVAVGATVRVAVAVGSAVAVAVGSAVEVGCTGIIVGSSMTIGTGFVGTTAATSLVFDVVSEQAVIKVIKVVMRIREINFLERMAK